MANLSRRQFLQTTAIGAAAAPLGAATRPNVLFVLADQWRASAFGFGSDAVVRTPNIDRLAKQGANWRRAYAANPVCTPNRASILTGRYSHQTGMIKNDIQLPPREVCWPEAFAEAGYATHYISRGCAAEAMKWTEQVMTRIGLTLNPVKTKLVHAKTESFDFLGYTFGPHRFRKDGHWYLGASPSKKSVKRLKQKVREQLWPSNVDPWEEVRDRLNRTLRGWTNYFSYGTRMPAYRAVDNFVYERVRGFLRRRHKVQSRGTRRFSGVVVFGARGVLRLRQVQLGPPSATAMR